jgi:hypothetical protein
MPSAYGIAAVGWLNFVVSFSLLDKRKRQNTSDGSPTEGVLLLNTLT